MDTQKPRNRKVCMLLTNPLTHDSRVYNEAKSLVNNGYSVTVIAKYRPNLKLTENLEGIQIIRIKTSAKSHLLSRFEFSLKLLKEGIKQKADVYHAHDLSTLLEGYLASRYKRSKLVYDSHEFAVRYHGHYQGDMLTKFKETIWAFLESMLIKRVDVVITVSRYMAEFLSKKYRLTKSPEVVMNCCRLVKNLKPINLKEKLGLKSNDKLILYHGNIVKGRRVDNLILSLNYLTESFKLAIISDCEPKVKNQLMAIISKNNLESRVFLLPKVPYQRLISTIAGADYTVIPFEDINLNLYYVSPNKLFESIMARVPIIATDFPFLRETIVGNGIGVVFSEPKPREMAEAILTASDPRVYTGFKRRLEEVALKYNWEIEEKALIKLYESLFKRTNPNHSSS